MHNFLYLQINVFAFVLMLLILCNLKFKSTKNAASLRLFRVLCIITAVQIVLDSILWMVDGKTSPAARALNLGVACLYYILTPLLCVVWAMYATSWVYPDTARKKWVAYWSIPFLALNAVLSILSLFGNFSFYIDSSNIYHRGQFFPAMAALCFVYLAYAIVLIFLRQKQLQKKLYIPSLFLFIPPLAASLFQTAFYGVSVIWITASLSALMIFINLQNDLLYMDHLTGLSNRRYLDSFLKEITRKKKDSRLLAGIMIDVNSFKHINDNYGHNTGDHALQYAGQLLLESLQKDDLAARYGGDEFVIILRVNDYEELHETVLKIRRNLELFNKKSVLPFEIGFSIGYDILDCDSGIDMQGFIRHIDKLMYKDKHNAKEKVLRETL